MRRPWSCWTTPTRSSKPPEAAKALAGLGAALALALSACSPGAPPGVDRDQLDAAVSRAIGDPNSCLLIAQAGSGKLYYRYNTHTACDREAPSSRRVRRSSSAATANPTDPVASAGRPARSRGPTSSMRR